MTPSGTQLGTDVRGPWALYFGDIYQDASSISHMVAFHTRLRFLGIPPNIFNKNANHKLLFCLQADKGQQVTERPQAFFLPLDQTDLIDLETKPEKDLTDLQEALRKNRPGSVLSR